MPTTEDTEARVIRGHTSKFAKTIDRLGLCLIYAFALAIVPLTAVTLLSGTV
jgi:hypothetical protein